MLKAEEVEGFKLTKYQEIIMPQTIQGTQVFLPPSVAIQYCKGRGKQNPGRNAQQVLCEQETILMDKKGINLEKGLGKFITNLIYL